ncbi:hypothetical protein Tco_0321235 [Tanacetum coccineum]
MYGKMEYCEDEDDCFTNFKTKFPVIVLDNTLTSDAAISCGPTVNPLNDNEIDFRILFDESDDEDYTVVYDKNSFSYKIIYVNNLKTDSKNDNDKVNMHSFPSPEPEPFKKWLNILRNGTMERLQGPEVLKLLTGLAGCYPSQLNNLHTPRARNKESILDMSSVTQWCQAIWKEKDPWSFTLPCFIHNICFDKALVDLGASVSVMPFSTYTNLGLGILSHTELNIEVADRTIKQPRGIAENVLVRIGKFIFPIDFIILDIPEDDDVPLILGRPFLSTANSKIEVFKRKITLRVDEEKLVFKSVKPAISIIKGSL